MRSTYTKLNTLQIRHFALEFSFDSKNACFAHKIILFFEEGWKESEKIRRVIYKGTHISWTQDVLDVKIMNMFRTSFKSDEESMLLFFKNLDNAGWYFLKQYLHLKPKVSGNENWYFKWIRQQNRGDQDVAGTEINNSYIYSFCNH